MEEQKNDDINSLTLLPDVKVPIFEEEVFDKFLLQENESRPKRCLACVAVSDGKGCLGVVEKLSSCRVLMDCV